MTPVRCEQLNVLLVSGDPQFISRVQSCVRYFAVPQSFIVEFSTETKTTADDSSQPPQLVIIDSQWSGQSASDCANLAGSRFPDSSIIVASDLDTENREHSIESCTAPQRVWFVGHHSGLASLGQAFQQIVVAVDAKNRNRQLLDSCEQMASRIVHLQEKCATGNLHAEPPSKQNQPSVQRTDVGNRSHGTHLNSTAPIKHAQPQPQYEPSSLVGTEWNSSINECRLSGRVLLAEDVPCNRRLLSFLLERAGAEVVAVEDGVEALKAFDEGTFDLVLLDMLMPNMDGYECCQELRRRKYAGPVIAITSRSLPSDREHCMNAGCDGYLVKPVDRNLLIRTVAEKLNSSEVGNSNVAENNEAFVR